MNKLFSIFAICVLLIIITSCNGNNISMIKVIKPNVFGNTQFNYNYTPAVAIQENYMYFCRMSGLLGIFGGETTIYRKQLDKNKIEKILKGGRLGYLSVQGEWIYYLNQEGMSVPGACELWKCKLDGTENTSLLKGEKIVDYQVYKDNIYFSVDSGTDEIDTIKQILKKADLNGNNVQTIYSNNFNGFTLSEDEIFVMDISSVKKKIVSINLTNNSQSLICTTNSDSYISYSNGFIYYAENLYNDSQICRISIENKKNEILYKDTENKWWFLFPFYISNENLVIEGYSGIYVLKIGDSMPKLLVEKMGNNGQLQKFCVFDDKIYFYQTDPLYECDMNTGKIVKIK